MALGDDGRVYTWGSSHCGQLGHGNFENDLSPRPVRGVLSVLGVTSALSSERTGLLCVCAWLQVDSLKRRVAAVAAGATHTLALVAAGTLYSWVCPCLSLYIYIWWLWGVQ